MYLHAAYSPMDLSFALQGDLVARVSLSASITSVAQHLRSTGHLTAVLRFHDVHDLSPAKLVGLTQEFACNHDFSN